MKKFYRYFLNAALVLILTSPAVMSQQATTPNPILFVTQLPIPDEWLTISQTFGNHLGGMNNVGRGGDLWIRYTDGTLRNLTEVAGYGVSGFQGSTSIAVRDPQVFWDGNKAVFSMVIGAPEQQYQYDSYYWQLYEITGLGQSETPVITKVPNQPEQFNNISPSYASDDRIIFTSDRPRNGALHLYPQLDEYESAPTNTGIWSLNPISGELFIMNHTPSGAFRPFVDSYGRVIYTRWDHLQQDQQNYGGGNGAFNWSSEAVGSIQTGSNEEIFPEERLDNGHINGNRFELFFPWMINQDGTEEEIINHIGRHELSNYFVHSFNDDPNLQEFLGSGYNNNRISNMFQIKERPDQPGNYIAIDSPTFYHHSAGRIFQLNGAPTANPDSMLITYLTPEGYINGQYRNPLPLSDGSMLSSYTSFDGTVSNLGDRAFPRSPFRFRLTTLQQNGAYLAPDQLLTTGIYKPVNFWDPDVMVTYVDSIPMWELDAVEVVARPRPSATSPELEAPEQQIFSEENIDINQLKAFMEQNDLALIVSRNVTTRDAADKQQPYNLRVPGGTAETIGAPGKVYDISFMQMFQADQVRGYQNYPTNGRRTLAKAMHEDNGNNIDFPDAPDGGVAIEADGSVAAFVPARRALSWQTTDSLGTPVVRERYWVTMQPGEIRVCAGCHGANVSDQAGNPAVENPPEALRKLMQHYQSLVAIDPADPEYLPQKPQLHGGYPNPFNPATTISYTLPERMNVEVAIYSVLGQKVAVLESGSQAAGTRTIRWDASSNASGVYLISLKAAGQQQTRKVVLLK
ncbi:MAG: T9SS type A sorting domain-containing protein [Calditrichia bacterium]